MAPAWWPTLAGQRSRVLSERTAIVPGGGTMNLTDGDSRCLPRCPIHPCRGTRLSRSIGLRVGARGKKCQRPLRHPKHHEEVCPYPVAPIAEVGLPFQMMCQESWVLCRQDQPDGLLNQTALGGSELLKPSNELIRVSYSSRRDSRLLR
jgi:hypothetical protein